jgi:hypothetical protein
VHDARLFTTACSLWQHVGSSAEVVRWGTQVALAQAQRAMAAAQDSAQSDVTRAQGASAQVCVWGGHWSLSGPTRARERRLTMLSNSGRVLSVERLSHGGCSSAHQSMARCERGQVSHRVQCFIEARHLF